MTVYCFPPKGRPSLSQANCDLTAVCLGGFTPAPSGTSEAFARLASSHGGFTGMTMAAFVSEALPLMGHFLYCPDSSAFQVVYHPPKIDDKSQ